MDEFDYFMIRIRRTVPAGVTSTLTGVAERLGTGEKWHFGSGEELLRLVGGEANRLENMHIFDEPSKP